MSKTSYKDCEMSFVNYKGIGLVYSYEIDGSIASEQNILNYKLSLPLSYREEVDRKIKELKISDSLTFHDASMRNAINFMPYPYIVKQCKNKVLSPGLLEKLVVRAVLESDYETTFFACENGANLKNIDWKQFERGSCLDKRLCSYLKSKSKSIPELEKVCETQFITDMIITEKIKASNPVLFDKNLVMRVFNLL